MKSICIVGGRLAAPGGAERVACWLANEWSRRGVQITLLTLGVDRGCFFPLEDSVQVQALGSESQGRNLFRSAAVNLSLIFKIRRTVQQARADCVIAFIDANNILTLLACRGLGIPVIVSERTDPVGMRLAARWALLRRCTYPFADCLVVQSAHALRYFPRNVQLRGRIIPNPVLAPKASGRIKPKDRHDFMHTVLGLGSLRPVKGFDRLIEAFARVAGRHPEWNLVIYGEGPARRDLEAQAVRLGVAGRVALPGVTSDSHECLRQADLFVLCSRNEGFPNALAEAMACGLAVVSFDCHSGPRELIRNGVDGVLVPDNDINELAMQMDRLMGDASQRERLGRRAPEVVERFSGQRVLELWQQAVDGVTRHSVKDAPAESRLWARKPFVANESHRT